MNTTQDSIRTHKRAWLSIPGVLGNSESSAPLLLRNLSTTGLLIHSPEAINLKEDQLLSLRLSLFPGLPSVSLEAKVVWQGKRQAGLRIVAIDERNRSVLKHLVEYHLA